MSPADSSNEGMADASGALDAPQAGFQAVIQHAVEHVTAFSATLEQRRAAAQLEQALEVRYCLLSLGFALSCQAMARVNSAISPQDCKAEFQRRKDELEEVAERLRQQLRGQQAAAEHDARHHACQVCSDPDGERCILCTEGQPAQ